MNCIDTISRNSKTYEVIRSLAKHETCPIMIWQRLTDPKLKHVLIHHGPFVTFRILYKDDSFECFTTPQNVWSWAHANMNQSSVIVPNVQCMQCGILYYDFAFRGHEGQISSICDHCIVGWLDEEPIEVNWIKEGF